MDKTTAEQSPIAVANNDGNSSDDESDSVDIGYRRKRRNRPKSERDKLTRREPRSPTKIRSLSEAISDIEARTRAAKQEMDYRSTRSQSESDNKTDVSNDAILLFATPRSYRSLKDFFLSFRKRLKLLVFCFVAWQRNFAEE